MKTTTLSMFPYYGGKAKLAPVICDLLEYDTTTTYIEAFGGACRTLLNKQKRHDLEMYVDSSAGLCAFVNLMSNPDTAIELIGRLYETEYSAEQFSWALRTRNSIDDDFRTQTTNELFRVYRKLRKTMEIDAGYKLDEQEGLEANIVLANWRLVEKVGKTVDNCYLGDTLNAGFEISELDLAVATFIIYTQSRDAMGLYWSSYRFKTYEDYYKRIDRLHRVAERLNGVKVLQADAMTLLRNRDYTDDKSVCIYADPSYLKPEDETKNLGGPYKHSWDRETHKKFLEIVHNAKCKMLISNYDVDLYNDYLRDWTKIEIPTKTSIGAKKDNKRTEILWYNY